MIQAIRNYWICLQYILHRTYISWYLKSGNAIYARVIVHDGGGCRSVTIYAVIELAKPCELSMRQMATFPTCMTDKHAQLSLDFISVKNHIHWWTKINDLNISQRVCHISFIFLMIHSLMSSKYSQPMLHHCLRN